MKVSFLRFKLLMGRSRMFGACVNAPMMQINEDYYEDLNETNTIKIIDSIIKNKPLKPGSYRGRKNTSPEKLKNLIQEEKNA